MSLKKLLLDCLFPQYCYGCGKSRTWLCLDCLNKIQRYKGQMPRHLHDIDSLIIAGEYSDRVLREMIKAFKFHFNTKLSVPLGIFLYQSLNLRCLEGDYILMPIPLHKKRLNWRGFNQSQLIAEEIGCLKDWPISSDLVKTKNTSEQADLKERERLENQRGVFKWQGADLAGKKILLVDDIITSGATISEAAAVLKQAGAEEVIAVAVAKG